MKQCTECGEIKPTDDFNKKGNRYQARCRPCDNAKSRERYAARLACDLESRAKSREGLEKRNKEFILQYLRTHGCVDCGNTDIRVLEFDHVHDLKKIEVTAMIGTGYSLKAIQDEIAKCEVRCANCHRIVTGERAGWYRSLEENNT